MNFDVVIIGGGIVGTACAARLTAEGLTVALVEKNYVASGVTSSGMGHIVVMDDSEGQFALTSLSRDLWAGMAPDMPAACEYANCGTIWVAVDQAELAEAERKQKFYTEHGLRARVVAADELYGLEPNLRKGLAGGLLVEDDSVVYQLSASRYFVKSAVRSGARLINAEAIKIDGSTVYLDFGEKITAGCFVNAAGVTAPLISPELKIVSKKGHLVITDRYPGFVSHQIVELGYLKSAHKTESDSVAFNIQPRTTGQFLIGSSRQPGASDKEADRATVRRMLNHAFEFIPRLKDISAIRVWTGNRPATPDNLPYIGRSTTNTKVIVAAGHEGLGITTATGTAELVADVIFERESRIPREPYLPERFNASQTSRTL